MSSKKNDNFAAMRKKESIKRSYTYGEFANLFRFCNADHQEELLDILSKSDKPMFIAGKEVPSSLNTVSYGMLDDLSNISKTNKISPVVEAISLVMGVEESEIIKANVFDVFGVANWIGREIERINKLFRSIAPNYTEQEIEAGVKNLSFGSFGVLDWYSRRQGISDQNEVRDVAWVRIYTCMKNDRDVGEYEKRLNKIYSKRK